MTRFGWYEAAMTETWHDLVRLLQRGRYRQGDEMALHADVDDHLTANGLEFEREVVLGPGSRIDFLLCGGIGIECKVRAGKRNIYRQLRRYAEADAVSALILLTGTALGLPDQINGKPVFLVSLGRSSL
jgi:hypothetical protein